MKIGKIISVEFDKFRVKILDDCRQSTIFMDGQVYYFGNIGSYLKTQNSLGDTIVCEVVAIFENEQNQNKSYGLFDLGNSRVLLIKPIGTFSKRKTFTMGVGIFPSIYNDVEIVTTQDLYNILSTGQQQEKSKPGIHKTIDIGYSKNLINYKISLSINRFFNIHSAVLGNSGSGKSNTIARILQEVYCKENYGAIGAKTILFDSNGEYPIAFSAEAKLCNQVKTVFYKPEKTEQQVNDDTFIAFQPFYLPYYLLNLDEWLAFLMASDRTQKPFWDRTLQMTYKFYSIFNSEKKDDKQNEKKYVNYFKWKILGIIDLILSQIDSDTAKITAARGIVGRCINIINQLSTNEELLTFIYEINDRCGISYGNNDSKLQEYASAQRKQIDEDLAWEVEDKKLSHGNYYDYRFLHTAVEMVLLEEEARGNTRIREFTSTMLTRLDFFINNPECRFMRETPIYSTTLDYLNKLFHIGTDELSNQLITIDSSEISTDILELMTSVVSRMIFDYRKKLVGAARRQKPIHLILDEAHRYIRKDADYILHENIFEQIAREGRKYSIFLIVSSQRPSELSSTVLSQCANFIVHRIQNEVDLKYIYAILPYFSEDFITKIKQSVPGEALLFGNCVPMPLQVQVIQANPDPNSKNCEVDENWFVKQ